VNHLFAITSLIVIALTLPAVAANEEDQAIIAVYDLESAISEAGQSSGALISLSPESDRPLTHFDIVRSLKTAAEDKNVKGVVLDLGGTSLNLAQIQEIRRCLLAIRKAGKDVWFYTETLSLGTALVGSAANHFTLLPEGNITLTGMYSESMYFKGLLDKLGLKVEVIHIGDFKSAGEAFYRTEPSEYARTQADTLFDSIYEQIIRQICAGRKIKSDTLRTIIDQAQITPEQAEQTGLVDALQYRTDFIATIRKHYGEDTEFDRSYHLPDINGPKIDGLLDLMKLAFNSGKDKKYKEDFVAVVALDDDINDQSVAPVRTEILKLAKNEKCKALVLRVNSPGGSALASDVLWEATDEFKSSNKSFVVSMGAVAASGGYYVSAGAQKIFAEEGTITGSIGVVGMKFILGGAMEKLGINIHSHQRGKNAGMMSTQRGFTPAEAEIIRKSMLDVYSTFKKRIIEGRGKRIKGDLEKLAGGRVYSGRDALKIGLIDEIGGLNEAIAHAASLAKLVDYQAHLIPEPKSQLEGMLAGPNQKDDDDDEFIRMTKAENSASLIEQHLLAVPGIQLLQTEQRAQLKNLIKRISSYQQHPILLIGPDLQVPKF